MSRHADHAATITAVARVRRRAPGLTRQPAAQIIMPSGLQAAR
jgi:hypothetical protein